MNITWCLIKAILYLTLGTSGVCDLPLGVAARTELALLTAFFLSVLSIQITFLPEGVSYGSETLQGLLNHNKIGFNYIIDKLQKMPKS